MSIERIFPRPLVRKAETFGIRAAQTDGMVFEDVDRAAAEAVAFVREESSPFFLECRTYRYFGHSKSDQRVYRTEREEREWKEKDPIGALEKRLQAAGIETVPLAEKARSGVEDAVRFAEESPEPRANPPAYA